MITIKWTSNDDLKIVEEILTYLDNDDARLDKMEKQFKKHNLTRRTKQQIKKDMKDKAKDK